MNFFDDTKSIIENLYFISGPLLFLMSLIAIRQLKIAKDNIRTNSKREAALISAKEVDVFLEKIIPLGDSIFMKKEAVKFPEFKGVIKNFTNDEFVDWDKEYTNVFFEKLDSLENLDLKFINLLEGFATYFTKGIADEEIAFSSVGKIYCRYVETYYPHITMLRGQNNPNKYYNNLIELYKLWKERLDKFQIEIDLLKKQDKIKEDIQNVEKIKKGVSKKSKVIKPLGTE